MSRLLFCGVFKINFDKPIDEETPIVGKKKCWKFKEPSRTSNVGLLLHWKIQFASIFSVFFKTSFGTF